MQREYPNLYKRARLSTGLTQEAAAERLSLSPESLKQYEGGRRIPPDDVVARMVEVYRLPWLALEHSQATDTLGVLPEVEPKNLVMSSVALENRLRDVTGRIQSLMRIAEDNTVDESERPETEKIESELWNALGSIYQTIFALEEATKKERPDTGMSKRSRNWSALLPKTAHLGCADYNTDPQRVARPNFSRRGGASL